MNLGEEIKLWWEATADRNLLEYIKVDKFSLFLIIVFLWSHESNLSRKLKGKCFRPFASSIPISGSHALYNLVRPLQGIDFQC